MTDLKNGERCVLCLDEKRSPVRIQCGHSFCHECLKLYKSYRKYAWANKCPICRDVLQDKKSMSKKKSPNSSVYNETHDHRLGSARTSGVTTALDPEQQTSILEEFIAIATEQDYTPVSTDLEDNDVDMGENYEEEEEGTEYSEDIYFTDSEDELDYETSIVDHEDYEAEIVANPHITIISSEEESNFADSSGTNRSSDSDVFVVDDVIIVVD